MIFIKDQAIVLRSSYAGSKDLSITLYIKGVGKENIYIKNGQVIKYPYLPVLQPLNWFKGVFLFYKEKILIKEIEKSVNLGFTYTKDLKKFETSLWILNLFDKYTIFQDEKLFNLLKNSIYHLQFIENEKLKTFKASFLLKYIYTSGIFPSMSRCIRCRKKINSKNFNYFSFKEGGSVCNKCSKNKKSDLTYFDIVKISKILNSKLKQPPDLILNDKILDKFINYIENH